MIAHLAVWIVPLLTALSTHEAAHALAATLLGDSTPRKQRRLTLYPPAHLGLVGGLLIPLLALSTVGGIIGWGLPVQADYATLRRRRFGLQLFAAAGPGANLLLALAWALALRYMDLGGAWTAICRAGVMANVWIGFANLLPVPPLDGWLALAVGRASSDSDPCGT